MRARWNDLPLRVRLTALYVGLLLALLVALGSFLYVDTRDFMISATALRLQSEANTAISHLFPSAPPAPLPMGQEGRTPQPPGQEGRDPQSPAMRTAPPMPFEIVANTLSHDLTFRDSVALIVDGSGTIVADGRAPSDTRIVPAPDPQLVAHAMTGDSTTRVVTVSGQDILVVLVPIRQPRPDAAVTGVVQLSTPLDLVDQIMQRQRLLIVIGVALALLIAAIGGMWLTQTTLTPLRLMVATCRRIAAGDLSQRVNLPQRRDETGQLASAFDEMVARLDDTFTTQRQFVADASHELRTPLTAISGSLEVLLLAPEDDPETTRRVLHGMRREVQRLTRLVSDLLTLTRLDARRQLSAQWVDLGALGREVVESMRSISGERQMVLETHGDVRCWGDADKLKQVFYNLLGNAIHSTDAASGAITVRVEGLDRTVRVAICDNGIGIPAASQPHIFERFYRVDRARTRASGGSGLGLAIVQAIVDGHGGAIEPVESAVGRGTTIRFTLPRGRFAL